MMISSPIQTNTSYIINLFLASYHEDVYRKLMEVAPKYTKYIDRSKKKDEEFTKDSMVCEIFLFLFNGIMIDESEIGRNVNTIKFTPKTSQLTFHKGFVVDYLINKLTSKEEHYKYCMGGLELFFQNLPKEIEAILTS